MYIKKIFLNNIRCFENLEINFDKNGHSALILGDNGDGKSTLLKSLAMGLCDESSAAGLHRELPGELVRKSSKKGIITIELEDKKRKYKIETSIESLPAFERIKQAVFLDGKQSSQESFPWSDIFVCGYGPGRQTQGTADLEEYAAVDAVYTLFRYYDPMQNSELAIRRLVEKARSRVGKNNPTEKEKRAERMLDRIRSLLEHVLNLGEKDKIFITPTGIDIKSHWGRNRLSSLGDGYKATVTWIMDFLSWRMLSGKSLEPKTMAGIVIIDEIEQHLHPRWQINIMRLLQESFPKIQFIASTHSPLVASGSEHCKIISLKRGHAMENRNVYGWLPEDVYREIMGLSEQRPSEVNKMINRYGELYEKRLTKSQFSPSEKIEFRNIRSHLDKQLPESDPITVTTKISAITDYLKKAQKKS